MRKKYADLFHCSIKSFPTDKSMNPLTSTRFTPLGKDSARDWFMHMRVSCERVSGLHPGFGTAWPHRVGSIETDTKCGEVFVSSRLDFSLSLRLLEKPGIGRCDNGDPLSLR
jgi:hypothetical protein